MKEYSVEYEIHGKSYLKVIANSEEEARNEIENVFANELPEIEENQWIDQDVVWNLEWECETTDVIEED